MDQEFNQDIEQLPYQHMIKYSPHSTSPNAKNFGQSGLNSQSKSQDTQVHLLTTNTKQTESRQSEFGTNQQEGQDSENQGNNPQTTEQKRFSFNGNEQLNIPINDNDQIITFDTQNSGDEDGGLNQNEIDLSMVSTIETRKKVGKYLFTQKDPFSITPYNRIYLATVGTNQFVAIKVFQKKDLRKNQLEKLKGEYLAIKNKSPEKANIMEVLDVLHTSTQFYVVFPYFESGNMKCLANSKQIPHLKLLEIMKQIILCAHQVLDFNSQK